MVGHVSILRESTADWPKVAIDRLAVFLDLAVCSVSRLEDPPNRGYTCMAPPDCILQCSRVRQVMTSLHLVLTL
jgi:hypothetical protein